MRNFVQTQKKEIKKCETPNNVLLSFKFFSHMYVNHNHLLRDCKVQSEYIIQRIKINYFSPFLKMVHNFSTDESICS
jgi:hypothetical protein